MIDIAVACKRIRTKNARSVACKRTTRTEKHPFSRLQANDTNRKHPFGRLQANDTNENTRSVACKRATRTEKHPFGRLQANDTGEKHPFGRRLLIVERREAQRDLAVLPRSKIPRFRSG